MDVRFILVSPAVPGNVGAAARALKTMGFAGLRLVASELHRHEEALWTAHGSRDVLENAETFPSLEDALADRDFVIAATARRRGLRHEYHPPERLIPLISGKGEAVRRPALVFGSEESGLSNRELGLCDCLSSVPMAAPHPSLNLAQAVMLYAYILSPLAPLPRRGPEKETGEERARRPGEGLLPGEDPASFRRLKSRAALLLRRIALPGDEQLGQRLLERLAVLDGDDLKLLHSLCARLEKALPPE